MTREEEMNKKYGKMYGANSNTLAQLVEGLGKQLSQLQIDPAPNVAGKDFPTPGGSQMQGLPPMVKSSISNTKLIWTLVNSVGQTQCLQMN